LSACLNFEATASRPDGLFFQLPLALSPKEGIVIERRE
jgi:hypothetical protein